MKLLNNLVEVKLLRDDDELLLGDKKLYVNTQVSVEEHRCLVGLVVNVPETLSFSKGNPLTPWKVPMELKPGDLVIMKRNPVSLATRDSMKIEDGERIIYIKYFDIVAYKREGEVNVINGIVLIEPIIETPNSTVFIPELAKKQSHTRGTVVMMAPRIEEYIEDHKFDFKEELFAGDIVTFKRYSDIPLEQHMHKFFDKRKLSRIYRNDIMLIERP